MTYFFIQGSGFRVQGSGFRWRLRRKKGSQPRLAALSSPFQGKGLAWMLPPSFGRRCPEGAEVGGGKRYPRHTAFPAWGRCSEGADRVALRYIPHCSITASMPLLPSALPPKGEARRYAANDFLNLIALPLEGELPEGLVQANWIFRGSTTVYPTLFDNRWHAPIAFGTSPEGGSKALRN